MILSLAHFGSLRQKFPFKEYDHANNSAKSNFGTFSMYNFKMAPRSK